MSITLAAVDAALISAQPVLAVTAYPLLAATAGVALWLRDQYGQDDDDSGVADYAAPAIGRAPVRRPVEKHTELIQLNECDLPPAPAGMDAGSPVYAELTARQILRELGQRARAGATA